MINFRFQSNRRLRDEVTSTRLNALLDELRRLRPLPGKGINVDYTGDGTRISALDQSGSFAGGGSSNRHPFQITSIASSDDENNNAYAITVRPGTINNLLPTGIFDGASLKQTEIGSGLQYVVLQAQSDGRQITSAAISVESSAPEAQAPVVFGLPSSLDVLLGIVKDASVFQVVIDNILVTGKQQFVAQKGGNVAPGELPYEIYYVWG
jgi:hypothetical protein